MICLSISFHNNFVLIKIQLNGVNATIITFVFVIVINPCNHQSYHYILPSNRSLTLSTDVAVEVVNLLQEMTSPDDADEYEEEVGEFVDVLVGG